MKVKILVITTALVMLLASCSDKTIDSPSGEPNFAGAYEEMNVPEFWIDRIKNPDEIIMSTSQIEMFNQNVADTVATKCVNLNKYQRTLSREELLKQLQLYGMPEETRYIGATPLDADYFEKLFENRNEASVQEQNAVRLGVIIRNTELRSWPTADVSYNETDDIEFDFGCETVVKTYERVAILHESTDKQWLYVQAYNYIGWARAEDVAFCSEDEWKSIAENTNWLTVTGNRVVLDQNNVNPDVSRRELTMGTRLILIQDKPDVVDGISTVSSYVVLLPVRDDDGSLKLVETRVPQSFDVTEGVLAYTPRNIVMQAYKMLGERYGWSSLWGARDCSSYIMDVYQCFGIQLPRNSSSQAAVPGDRVDVSNYNDNDKRELLLKQSVGTLLELKGHIMMYLGEYEGEPYVIHQPYEFIPQGDTFTVEVACVLVSDLEIKRSGVDKV